MNEITNDMDYIDSRFIIERIEELEFMKEDGGEIEEWEEEELQALLKLQDECAGYSPDWKYGATLIRRSKWVEYCEELCSDCGYISSDIPWWIVIDWEKTADNIEEDYTSVYFDDVEYLIR